MLLYFVNQLVKRSHFQYTLQPYSLLRIFSFLIVDRSSLQNVIDRKPHPDDENLVEVKFATTPIMSTYLVAFVIGEYDYVESQSSDGVMVRVYTPVGKAEQGKFALEVRLLLKHTTFTELNPTCRFIHCIISLPWSKKFVRKQNEKTDKLTSVYMTWICWMVTDTESNTSAFPFYFLSSFYCRLQLRPYLSTMTTSVFLIRCLKLIS